MLVNRNSFDSLTLDLLNICAIVSLSHIQIVIVVGNQYSYCINHQRAVRNARENLEDLTCENLEADKDSVAELK